MIKAISHATSGGVNAVPSREQEWVIPCAKARFSTGSQSHMARVATGKVAPSPNPSKPRANSMAPKVVVTPVSSVALPQTIAETVSVHRAPNRSLSAPPKIVKIT